MPDNEKTTNGHACDTAAIMANLLLDKDQTAAVLNVPPATIENLHRARLLRGCLVGKHLRWRPSDVRKYVDSLEAANV